MFIRCIVLRQSSSGTLLQPIIRRIIFRCSWSIFIKLFFDIGNTERENNIVGVTHASKNRTVLRLWRPGKLHVITHFVTPFWKNLQKSSGSAKKSASLCSSLVESKADGNWKEFEHLPQPCQDLIKHTKRFVSDKEQIKTLGGSWNSDFEQKVNFPSENRICVR